MSIDSLAKPVALYMISFLPEKDIYHLSLTNKKFYALCGHDVIWKKRVEETFQEVIKGAAKKQYVSYLNEYCNVFKTALPSKSERSVFHVKAQLDSMLSQEDNRKDCMAQLHGVKTMIQLQRELGKGSFDPLLAAAFDTSIFFQGMAARSFTCDLSDSFSCFINVFSKRTLKMLAFKTTSIASSCLQSVIEEKTAEDVVCMLLPKCTQVDNKTLETALRNRYSERVIACFFQRVPMTEELIKSARENGYSEEFTQHMSLYLK